MVTTSAWRKVVFYGKVDSYHLCEAACVADLQCTGYVWTNGKSGGTKYNLQEDSCCNRLHPL